MTLNHRDQATIQNLQRSNVELSMVGLKPHLQGSMWLSGNNRYVQQVVRRLDSDFPQTAGRKRDLSQYIAASTVLHASDGWGYLGRSIAALLSGDPHRALHLAYYAELRACMSLLAGTGVGIFDKRHFVISGVNSTDRLETQLGTHTVAWKILQIWSVTGSSGSLFSKLIRPEGQTLEDWFQPHGGGAALAAQAERWFMQWGMDLRMGLKDRNARNESSYRPDGIPSPWVVSPATALDFVTELWATLEPGSSSRFDQIDRYILRLALESHFKGITGSNPSANNHHFIALIGRTVAAQSLSPAGERRLTDFLLRKTAPNDPLLFGHSALALGSAATDHFAIISRAVLLLRVATGSAQDLLQQAGMDAAALTFWWTAVGEARGLWEPGTPPDELHELWGDIQDTLLETSNWKRNNIQARQSVKGIVTGLGHHLAMLCSHDRVGLWGLCPP